LPWNGLLLHLEIAKRTMTNQRIKTWRRADNMLFFQSQPVVRYCAVQ
jgi:hypothetical protein